MVQSILYRAAQFWHTVFIKDGHQELAIARQYLTLTQWSLFIQMQRPEQAHALRVLLALLAQDENQPDLLVAALLHDVGKIRYRLNPIQRAMVVVTQAIVPRLAREWGGMPLGIFEALPGWRKTFVLAGQHADWGAELAHQAGVSSLAESLIRHHHRPLLQEAPEGENKLLHALRAVDDAS